MGEATGEGCCECGRGILRVPDAEVEAASAIAENVARRRENDVAFERVGRFFSVSPDEGGGGRRDVQIREDKQGHIIWEGLREVSVRNSNEVMK